MFSSSRITPPKINTHTHNYYELLYFVSGDAVYLCGADSYAAKPGDMFITRPGEAHMISFNSPSEYERYFIQINKEYMSGVSPDYDMLGCIDEMPSNRIPRRLCEKYGLAEYFFKIAELIETPSKENLVVVKAYVIQLLAAINKIITSERLDNSLADSRVTAEIKEYIDKHFTEEITLDLLAGEFFVNKYYMCHIFKSDTGITIMDFINMRRVNMAKQLLSKAAEVGDLYLLCGFKDYSVFFKTFKKFTGKPPSNFLKK